MIMGFILPFALAFVAIPLESFITSGRTVLGIIAAGLLNAMVFLLRLAGNIIYYAGKCVTSIYDLIIFPPLWLEGVIVERPFKIREAIEKIAKSRRQTKADGLRKPYNDRTHILESRK